MGFLTFLSLAGLLAFTLVLSRRVKALEREVERLGGAEAVAAPPGPEFVGSSASERPAAGAQERVPARATFEQLERERRLEAEPESPVHDDWEEAASPRETLAGFFERWVGGRLMIWVGGIALAVAGVLLVRYSIQIGLITPPVQMGMAALFGLLLLALGEFARSRADWALDRRVAQALVGAGILVLYATAYGSLVLHHLIGNGTAFGLMVMVTGAALVLSLRHGAPSAVMGLVGGFLTPLLVGERSETAIPLLTYLALLDVALFTLAGRRGWTWLAAAAALLSFGWSAALLGGDAPDALAAGVFVLLVGIGASVLRAGPGWQLDFLRPAAIGLVQLAVLVGRQDIGLPAWGVFGVLSAACLLLESRKPEYRPLPAIALGLSLILIAIKAFDQPLHVPAVAAAATSLFALGSLPAALRRERPLLPFATACAGFIGPAWILRVERPEWLDRPLWGLLFLLLAAGPLFLAWSRRRAASETAIDAPLVLAAGSAMVSLAIAAWQLLPANLVAGGGLVIALLAALASRRLGDRGVAALALAAAAAASLWAAGRVPQLWETLLLSLAGEPALASQLPGVGAGLQNLLLPALLLAAIWRLLPAPMPALRPAPLALAAGFAGAAAYLLFKQAFDLSSGLDFVARGFAERTILNQALFAAGWLVCSGRIPIRGLDEAARWLAGTLITALAATRLVWFDMLLHNPVLAPQNVGGWPVLNLLAPAYLLSAFWLYRARRGADARVRSGAWLLLALASVVLGVMLMVRQGFQGAMLDGPDLPSAESYGYSLAGLLLSVALLLGGIRLADKALRLAGLVLLTATTVKVFLVDAGALEGVLRILSFLVLGIALIGIGKLYTKVLDAEARPARQAKGEEQA
ncbi:MAG TPA: DUF2339 domain-containing protein [Allosphingosinicella sp.]|jgi:uncharacterized membrane protein|nr:DUF2339 domain-containing protein [Allosphingosinicella sp.]